MTISEFLLEQEPEQFDFKDLMAEYYRKCVHEYEELLQNLKKMDGADPVKKWFLYKTLDGEVSRKLFDCDSSNGTCELTDQIYEMLWPDQVKDGSFEGDTMNSYATTFGRLGECLVPLKPREGSSFKRTQDLYEAGVYEAKDKIDKICGEFARSVSCIGNFVLVPDKYNGKRGRSAMKDYWDLSLENLRLDENKKRWVEIKVETLPFEQYINLFFLWDYVDKDYHVVPLFSKHKELLPGDNSLLLTREKVLPSSETEIKEFMNNVNVRIRRRGIFMCAMLRIVENDRKEYAKIREYFMNPEERFHSMEDAMDRLQKEKIVSSAYAIETLRNARSKISEISILGKGGKSLA